MGKMIRRNEEIGQGRVFNASRDDPVGTVRDSQGKFAKKEGTQRGKVNFADPPTADK